MKTLGTNASLTLYKCWLHTKFLWEGAIFKAQKSVDDNTIKLNLKFSKPL